MLNPDGQKGVLGMTAKHNPAEAYKLRYLPLDTIRPNPAQPRRQFDSEELRSLSESIRANGILQPLTVRAEGKGYVLIAGERRLRAAKLAGLSRVPCCIRPGDEKESAVLAMLENLQRKDLTPREEALGLLTLIEGWGVSQEEAARRLGKSQPAIANKLRLLRLSEPVWEQLERGNLTERHARALLRLPEELREQTAATAAEQQLTVSQTEELVEKLLTPPPPAPKPRRVMVVRDVRIFLNTIRAALDTMKNAGIPAEEHREQTDTYIQYTIRIPLG